MWMSSVTFWNLFSRKNVFMRVCLCVCVCRFGFICKAYIFDIFTQILWNTLQDSTTSWIMFYFKSNSVCVGLPNYETKLVFKSLCVCVQVEGGSCLYKLCIESIKRGRQIKRQIVPLVGAGGNISCNTIQTAIGQFNGFQWLIRFSSLLYMHFWFMYKQGFKVWDHTKDLK